MGQTISCGDVVHRVEEPILRCSAIQVDPQSGETDMALLRPLARRFDEPFFGGLRECASRGRLKAGASLTAPVGGTLTDRASLGLR